MYVCMYVCIQFVCVCMYVCTYVCSLCMYVCNVYNGCTVCVCMYVCTICTVYMFLCTYVRLCNVIIFLLPIISTEVFRRTKHGVCINSQVSGLLAG